MATNSIKIKLGRKLLLSCQMFSQLQPKKVHEWAQIGHQELVSHHIITHWIHVDDMKWLSIN